MRISSKLRFNFKQKNTNNTEKIILFKIIIDEINYNFPKIFESKISNKEDFSYLINFFKDYSNSNKKYQTVFEKIFNNKNKIKVLDNIKSYFFNNNLADMDILMEQDYEKKIKFGIILHFLL